MSFWDTGRGFAVGIGLVIAGTALALAVGAWVSVRLSLPGQLADIEQLRADAANIDPAQAEDVIGQVTVWNRTIAENRALNATWYGGWYIPDEWDHVDLIPVPR